MGKIRKQSPQAPAPQRVAPLPPKAELFELNLTACIPLTCPRYSILGSLLCLCCPGPGSGYGSLSWLTGWHPICCCGLTPACGSLCPQGGSVFLNGECSFGAILCGALACLSGWSPTCPHTSLLTLLQPLAGQRNFVKGCSSDNDTWFSWSFVSRDAIPQEQSAFLGAPCWPQFSMTHKT